MMKMKQHRKNKTHHVSVLVSLCAIVFIGATATPHHARATTDEHCFAETGFCMAGRIREFWQQYGGLAVFGYPLAPQQTVVIEGTPYQAQVFERYRLELHPENSPPYDVLLGRLGVDRLMQQGRDWHAFPPSTAQSGCLFFAQTQQTVCGDILTAWRTNGIEFDGVTGFSQSESLALSGLPISPPQEEVLSDGNRYIVQWFERARFEQHPELKPPYHILRGLLAKEVLMATDANNEGDNTPMEVTADTSILAAPRTSAAQAASYITQRGTTYTPYDVQLITNYYWETATSVGVDPLVAMAQCLHETANLQSWWSQRPRRNPAGLGVTGETSTTPPPANQMSAWAFDEEAGMWKKGLSFADWRVAARAHIGRLLAYVIRDDAANDAQRALIAEALALRPLPANLRGVAPTLRGLNGRWAVPGTTYADRIATFANAILTHQP